MVPQVAAYDQNSKSPNSRPATYQHLPALPAEQPIPELVPDFIERQQRPHFCLSVTPRQMSSSGLTAIFVAHVQQQHRVFADFDGPLFQQLAYACRRPDCYAHPGL